MPTLKTGESTIEPLSEVEFHAYTDLLMYDMGPELDDGYTEGTAASNEWRTAPLWGVGIAKDFQGGGRSICTTVGPGAWKKRWSSTAAKPRRVARNSER